MIACRAEIFRMTKALPKQKNFKALCTCLGVAAWCALVLLATPAAAEGGRFDGYEIRVIRPRFMNKTGRIELGAESAVILNQAFIYTFMVSGLLDYHFSETWALELGGAYGFSIDKADKTLLFKDFGIHTAIQRTQYIASAGALWTPVYGKTQLSNGQVVYFDSFITAQVGLTGINYKFEQCTGGPSLNGQPDTTPQPAPVTKGYPSVSIGAGQKYFVSQDYAIRWEVRDNIFAFPALDGACPGSTASGSELKNNITLQIGASTFF